MITFEDHPRIPNRTVARSAGGGHVANIVARNMGGHVQYEVKPFVRWIGSQTFNSLIDAITYIRSFDAE